MSQRGKRPNCNPVDGPSPIKRRKGRPPTISIEDDFVSHLSSSNGGSHQNSSTVWQARPHLDLKMSSIYNRSAPEAPAELFRKDLISAMKLPDSEPLSHEEYWVITDQWKQEWERGVQVPVNPDSLPEPSVRHMNEDYYYKARQDFKLPKNKYIRITKDENFSHDKNYLSNTPAIADSVCSYDLDQLDEAWLKEFNGERGMCGLPPVNEEQFERIIEELETRCHDKIQAIMKSEDGLGIEYDENVICDVCRSPDSEEANEMVFCDNCNICVHQACYGITTIPSGQWLCRTCSMGQKPDCVLCPNKGGAMKSTRSGQKWAHVSCALWIPEVSIGSVDRMEPITKISSIPQSRWALVCVLCRERVGACIQCSVKTCKTAYHVTCAFQHGLEMRAIIEDENAEDGVKLRSYCQKHSVKKEPKNSANSEKASGSGSEPEEDKTSRKKVRKEMTSEERNHARLARLLEIQSEFDKHVSIKDISCHLLDVDQEGINHIYNYWILKRKAGGNEPLLLPKAGDVDVMSQTDQEQADIEKMKMFVHLRQDLERVRNLCYMVSRREKLSRSFFKMREQIFHKQVAILSSHKKLDDDALKAILEANHGPSIYDVLYSSDTINEPRIMRVDEMIDSILGNNVSAKSNKSILEINGNIKREKVDAASRYLTKFNGGNITNRKYSSYDSLSSDSDGIKSRRSRRKSHLTASTSANSSSEDESAVRKSPIKSKLSTSPISPAVVTVQPKKKGRPPGSTKQATAEKRRLLNTISSKEKPKSMSIDSSSEEDIKHLPQSNITSPLSTRNKLTRVDDEQQQQQQQQQQQHLSDESDELVPIKNSSGHSIPTSGGTIKKMHSSVIYTDSDSSSTDKDNRTDHTVSDSQQQPFRTKAAMKEFNENEVLPFNKPKKLSDVNETKKNATSMKKPSAQTKKPNLPPPQLKKEKEMKSPPSKATKSRRMSTKPQSILSSDSEIEDTKTSISKETATKDKDKKSNNIPKKDILPDFLVVPQREAAKKASENLMKTNSSLMVQSVAGTASEKSKKDAKEKLEDTMAAVRAAELERERQEAKDAKLKSSKASKEKSSKHVLNKEDSKKSQKDEKNHEKEQKIKEKEEKIQSDFASEFLPYVPQRQAAKKAAEHIKGLGNSSSQQAIVVVEEKSKQVPPTAASKKAVPDRRKSTVVDLSSSSSSSTSQSETSSSSESETTSPKPTTKSAQISKLPSRTMPSRRPSTAPGLKQKTNDSPFLDKATKSAVNVESSSSSSSYESDSSSDRVNTSRLSEKGNKSKRKSTEQPTTSKSIASASPKKSASTKKEANDKTPSRRMSTANKSQQQSSISAPYKTPTSNRSPQKPPSESIQSPESTITSRKRTSSTTSQSKVPSNNKSRTTESSKRDLAKLPDKGKSLDVKESDSSDKNEKENTKKRRASIVSPARLKETPKSEKTISTVVEKEKAIKEKPSKKEEAINPIQEKSIEKDTPKEIEIVKESTRDKNKDKSTVENKKQTPRNEVVEILDDSEKDDEKKDKEREKENEVKKETSKLKLEVENAQAKMDTDETVNESKTALREKSSKTPVDKKMQSPVSKAPTPISSPMISIPTENLNCLHDKKDKNTSNAEENFQNMPNRKENNFNKSDTFFEASNNLDKEDTERETYTLIEKLRQKNKKAGNVPLITDNNNVVVNEKPSEQTKSSCMHQNENIPKNEEQIQPNLPAHQVPFKHIDSSQLLQRNDSKFDDLRKSSTWNQQPQIQPTIIPGAENNTNYQRNILTSTCNQINSTIEQPPALASCMVIEQQQKQLAACQKMGEENMISSNRGAMFLPPLLMNEQTNHHMDMFNLQMQQQQPLPMPQDWQKDNKSFNLKMMQQQQQQQQQHDRNQSNLVKRSDSGMENMMNNMNQQNIKNFPPLHKSALQNNFGMYSHPPVQQGNFNSFNFPDTNSQFPGPVSLFPSDLNVQVPLPSPGMFPPNFNSSSFTSTQHQNDHSMMIQTSSAHIKMNSNEISGNIHFSSQSAVCQTTHFNQQRPSTEMPPMIQTVPTNQAECNNSNIHGTIDKHQDNIKRSPSKSVRSSPRNNTTPTYGAGGKTPQKSPSKSPRQPSTPVSTESLSRQNSQKGKSTPTMNEGKQRKSRTNSQASPASTPAEHRSNKGRPRNNKNSKNRFPQNMTFIPFNNEIEYLAINKKLVGTVYDFNPDEDLPTNPSVENLRAMRDRRKSIDLHSKINKDGSSQSPKFSKSSLKPSTPITHPLALNNHTMPNTVVNETILPVASGLTSLNLVNMPGPVDMRTYNSFDNTNDSYNSQLLGAFAANTVDQTLNEIDEEQEKELQIALKASTEKQKTVTTSASVVRTENKVIAEINTFVEESVDSEASFAKVSLSDSRNQLKLKIKGPLAHHHDMQSQSISHTQIAPIAASGTSSNRRQMRKKELLQQYWNQGMNTDQDVTAHVTTDQHTSSSISSSRVGGIPKAVDSMGLGLLKDEFQDFNYAEYKKRKRFAIRNDSHNVDIDMGIGHVDIPNPPIESDPLAIESNNKKRRNRSNRGTQLQQNAGGTNPPPKLKIKIGTDVMETTGSDLPPKKRLIAQPLSFEDIRRESMNFRKQMMEEFSEQKSKEQRTKTDKRDKKEKKKRKKEKKRSVEIVSHPAPEGAPVKLILKISSKTSSSNVSGISETNSNANEQSKIAPPIKLKLSRNSHGNGEYNILNTSLSKEKDESQQVPALSTTNNNNLQPPVIDSADINSITTKKLEVALERIDDIEKMKSEIANKHAKELKGDITSQPSKDCEVR